MYDDDHDDDEVKISEEIANPSYDEGRVIGTKTPNRGKSYNAFLYDMLFLLECFTVMYCFKSVFFFI
jgi:hypothetical protein